MGVKYSIIPLSYDEQLIEWIKSFGLIPDETSRVGSDPLFEEIVEIVDRLPECSKKHHDSFIEYFIDVKCDDDYSTIHIFTDADRIVTHLSEADMLINPEYRGKD